MQNRCASRFVWVDCRGLSVWALVFYTLCVYVFNVSVYKQFIIKFSTESTVICVVECSFFCWNTCFLCNCKHTCNLTLVLQKLSCDRPSSDGEPCHENGISDGKDPGEFLCSVLFLVNIIGDDRCRVSLYKGRVFCGIHCKKW